VERWRAALAELGDLAAEVRWRYGAFELDPTVPAEGVDARAYLEAKYDATTVAEIHSRLAGVAAAEGLPLRDMDAQAMRPNTFAAHRLLTAALEAGSDVQQALADGLFRAYWAEGRDVGDLDVLADVAEAAGLPGARALDVLAGDDFADDVRAEERRALESGIHAVPTFVIGRRVAISGAQPPEALALAVRHALGADAR
jgi:predicted DsbA family dithiol-disulfide isomerase